MFKKGDKVRCKFAYASDYKNIIAGKSYTVCDSSYGRWHQFTNVIGENGDERCCLSYQFELVTEKENNLQNLEVKTDTSATQYVRKESLDNATSRIEELENQLDEVINTKDTYKRLYENSKNEIDTANDLLNLLGIQEKILKDGDSYPKTLPLATRIALYRTKQQTEIDQIYNIVSKIQ